MTVESLDMPSALALIGNSDDAESWRGFDNMFRAARRRLEAAGCEVAAIASVTPHLRQDAIFAGASIPFVSVLDAAASAVADERISSATIVGTPVTMRTGLFNAALKAQNIEPGRPSSPELIDQVEQLLKAHFYSGNGAKGRGPLLDLLKSSGFGGGGPAVLLACTDFAAAFTEFAGQVCFEVEDITFVDAGAAHVAAILNAAAQPT